MIDALKTEESDYNFRMYSKEKIQKINEMR